MTNYTKSTNFTSKDSLSVGNPLKIVKGTEIDAEFNNIATAVATKADLLSPALTGTPTAPTASTGASTTQVATTAFVANAIAVEDAVVALKAPLASPALTGTPTAPTAAVDVSTTQLATTAFVIAQAASATPLANGTAAVGTSTRFARQDHVHALGGLGVGQTWQNMLASRTAATNYTNSTGKPIQVNIWGINGTAVDLVVDGVVANRSGINSSVPSVNLTAIIPNGSVYSCTACSTIYIWAELR